MGSVSEAKYTFWHTIVALADASGMPKEEWCRKNCISLKTFKHYEGIFRRQEARKETYYKEGAAGRVAGASLERLKRADTGTSSEGQIERVGQPADEVEGAETDDTSPVAFLDKPSETDGLNAGNESVELIKSADSAKSTETSGADKGRYFEVPMSDRNQRKGEGGQNKGQKSKASAPVVAEPDNPETMEPSIEEEADRAVAARQTERTGQEGHHEIMSHTAGVSDEGSARDAITIEADGFKLVIGSDVGEEALRNILKAVQGNA